MPTPTPTQVLAASYLGTPGAEEGSMYGAWVAVDAYTAALLRHGTWDRYELFAAPSRREAAAERARALRPSGVEVLGYRDLRARAGQFGLSAWHVPELDGAIPFYLRRTCARDSFPVTLLHHTISYQSQLHRTFLPLLLEDVRSCDAIICTSSAARQAVAILLEAVAARFNRSYGADLRFEGRLETVPLGVDTDRLAPRDKELARRELRLPADALSVLYLGRVSALDKADLSPLLHAFADVRQYAQLLGGGQSERLVLVIAGADPAGSRPVLEQQARALGIADDVRFHAEVDEFSKSALYGAADVFVAPTDNIQETFGLTPVEAMACGVPQVVADWDGYRDRVVDSETGFLVPTLWMQADADLLEDPFVWLDRTDHASLAQSVAVDPTHLRAALTRLVMNPELRHATGRASRKRAEEIYGWPRIVARLEALWTELTADAPGAASHESHAPDYQRPLFFDAFGHYASAIVDESWSIRRSNTAPAALAETGALGPVYGDMDPDVARRALEAIADAGSAVGDVLRMMRAEVNGRYPEATLRRQLMQLVKYGYVQLSATG